MKSYIDRIFWKFEWGNEYVTTYLRLAVALILVALFFSRNWPEPHRFSWAVLSIYTLIALATVYARL